MSIAVVVSVCLCKQILLHVDSDVLRKTTCMLLVLRSTGALTAGMLSRSTVSTDTARSATQLLTTTV